jgi:hypothetical protein
MVEIFSFSDGSDMGEPICRLGGVFQGWTEKGCRDAGLNALAGNGVGCVGLPEGFIRPSSEARSASCSPVRRGQSDQPRLSVLTLSTGREENMELRIRAYGY